ncbi:MAG: hypothetical protein WDN30_03750 [Pararobbsia sp.]
MIASGGRPVSDPLALLWARGIDTLIGCSVALLVYALLGPRGSDATLRQQIVRTLTTVQTALEHIATGSITTDAALHMRRGLQVALFTLLTSYEAETGGIARRRRTAERMRPAIVATQRLSYKVLAVFWLLEAPDGDAGIATMRVRLTADELATVKTALAEVIAAVRQGAGADRASAVTVSATQRADGSGCLACDRCAMIVRFHILLTGLAGANQSIHDVL